MARGGATALSSNFSFWAANWAWVSHSTTFRVTGPFEYAAVGKNALLDLDLRARRREPKRLTWELNLHGRGATGVVGGAITFKFNTAAFADFGEPQILPGNRGWSWGGRGGPTLTMRFEPPLLSAEMNPPGKSELRMFFFKGQVPAGTRRYVATLEMANDVAVVPSTLERFGLPDPTTWPSEILDWKTSPVDLSFLNAADRPAGKRGFVRVVDDRLVFEDGTPARFWGTNLSGAALFATTRENVRQQARRLSELGFNLVRLHHHDSPWVNPNVFGDRDSADTRSLSPAALEKIDWWVKCLKDEGIYVWLDLHVQRHFRPGDGIDGFDEIRKGKRVADLKGYNYVNASIRQAMKRFNELYLNRENPYTRVRYTEEAAIVAMLITNENDLTRHFAGALLPDKKVPKHNALYMSEAEAFARTTGLAKDRVWRSWETGPAKLFLNHLEHGFNADMIAHLRRQGVSVPIVTTSTWGGNALNSLPALSTGNLVDVHSYGGTGELEKHPVYAATLVHWMAAAHLSGKPLTVSEWNVERFPVPDRHAIPLYVAASARFQGWPAVVQYAYAQAGLNSAGSPSNWHAFNDPALLGTLPAAALLYRRGDVATAKRVFAFAPSKEQLFHRSVSPANSVALRTLAETGKLVVVLPRAGELPWVPVTPIPSGAVVVNDPDFSAIAPDATEVISEGGELRRNWNDGTYFIDTPKTQAAMGWIGGKKIRLADIEIKVTTRNATVVVQSLDERPIASSRAILVSMAAQSLPQSASRLPFHSEPVEGQLAIRAPKGLGAYKKEKASNIWAARLPAAYSEGWYTVRLERSLNTYWLVLR